MESINRQQKETKKQAYDAIMKQVSDTELPLVSKNIIAWALVDYFNIEVDVFETKEEFI